MAGEDEVRPVVRDRSLPPPNPARAYRILLAGGELVLRIGWCLCFAAVLRSEFLALIYSFSRLQSALPLSFALAR